MKLSHACGATQNGQVMVERSDKMLSAGEGNGKPLQYSCLENPMHSMKRQWPQDWKRSVFIPIPKKGNVKECSNYHTTTLISDNSKECANYGTIALISHASKVMLKILQARLQQYVNHEHPDVQAGFIKGRETRDQIANICWIMGKNKRVQEKHIFLLY